MKLHLPASLRRSLLVALFPVAVVPFSASAAILHPDVSMQTYTDFGQNRGRYAVGNTNALLAWLNSPEQGGVTLSYTGGQADYTLQHGMIDFAGIVQNGAGTLVGYNHVATVAHNGEQHVTLRFAANDIGQSNSQTYKGIEYPRTPTNNGSTVFMLQPGSYDYKLTRLSKIVTDVSGSTVYGSVDGDYSGLEQKTLAGQLLYRAGGGTMYRADGQGGIADLYGAYGYITGGVERIDAVQAMGENDTCRLVTNYFWADSPVDEAAPLPFKGDEGDSGSPLWVWNENTEQYEYIAALVSGTWNGVNNHSTACKWTQETLNSHDVTATVGSGTIYLGAISTAGQTITDELGNSTTLYSGVARDVEGNELATYRGVQSGLSTWGSLRSIRDDAKWYTKLNDFFNTRAVDAADLFFNDNLVLSAASSSPQLVQLDATVDLGVGYVQFSRAEGVERADFTVQGGSSELNAAGFVVDEGVTVHMQLNISEANTREWRKVGAGELIIEGNGNNSVLLNLGGEGTTTLKRIGGYAAYNVLANNGTTVVISDTNQIARDFTFGNRGGVLDMNGQSMTWNNAQTNVAEQGFTIHALDEQAVITNRAEQKTTLNWTQGGSQTWLGSFTDSEKGALEFIYNGGSGARLDMHSIHTNLQHADSGLTVQSGTVSLSGMRTVHGIGSVDGTTLARYSHEDDWHYADATMAVEVQSGATFELGSHARLRGNVTVENGATYLMREGVRHELEYIEGGARLESTAAISDFYGHKGNVQLNEGAQMRIAFSAGTDADMEYDADITGKGNLSIDLGTGGSVLRLTGTSDFSGTKELLSGGLYAASNEALGDTGTNKWNIGEKAWLASDGFTEADTILDSVDEGSTGVLALTHDLSGQIDLSAHQGLIIGAAEGCTVTYGSAGEALEAVEKQWKLGGGGGELRVEFRLSGDNDLVLGNEYGMGHVHLGNGENDVTGSVIFGGGVTLSYAEGALGHASTALSYGNRLLLPAASQVSIVQEGADGVLLMDSLGAQALDIASRPDLTLGSEGDCTYSGELTVAEDAVYRFGGSTGTLRVTSTLAGGHDLVVDGQGFSGGILELENSASLTGKVSIMGRDAAKLASAGGNATLRLTQQNALANAFSIEVKEGGVLDLNGHNQSLSSLVLAEGGRLADGSASPQTTLTLGQGSVMGSVEVARIVKEGNETLTWGGSNSYTSFDLRGGKVILASSEAMSSSATMALREGTTLDIGSYDTNGALVMEKGSSVTGRGRLVGILDLLGDARVTAANITGDVIMENNATLTASLSQLNLSSLNGSGHLEVALSSTATAAATIASASGFMGSYSFSGEAGTGVVFATGADLGTQEVTLNGVSLIINNANSTAPSVAATLRVGEKGASLMGAANNAYSFSGLAGSGAFRSNLGNGGTIWFRGDVSGFSGSLDATGSSTTIGFGGSGVDYHRVTGAAGSEAMKLFASNQVELRSSDNVPVNYVFQYADDVILNARAVDVSSVTQSGTGRLILSEASRSTGTLTIHDGGTVELAETGSWLGVLAGSGTLVNRNSSAAGASFSDASSFSGSLSLMQGSKLGLGSSYTLSDGKSIEVFAGGAGLSATLSVDSLVLDGGDFRFDGKALSGADVPALDLECGSVTTGVKFGGGQTIAFHSTTELGAGSYLLASGDWSAVSEGDYRIEGIAGYLTSSLSAGADGLRLTLSEADGSLIWAGTSVQHTWSAAQFGDSATPSAGNSVYFTDTASNNEVMISGSVEADGLVFNATQDYHLRTEGDARLSASSLELMDCGKVSLGKGVNISGVTTLAEDSEVEVKDYASLGGEVRGHGTLSVDAGVSTGSESLVGLDTLHLLSGRYEAASAVGAETIRVEGGQIYFTRTGSYANDLVLSGEGWRDNTSDIYNAAALRSGGGGRVNLSGDITLLSDVTAVVDRNATMLLQSALIGNGRTLTLRGSEGAILWLDSSSRFAAENVSFAVESGTLRLGGTSGKGLLSGITSLSAKKGGTLSLLASSSSMETDFRLEGGSSLELTATNNTNGVSYDLNGDMQLIRAADGSVMTSITSAAGRNLHLNGLLSGEGGFSITGKQTTALSLTLSHADNSFAGGIRADRANVTINLSSAGAAGTGTIVLGSASSQLNVAGNTDGSYGVMENVIAGAGKLTLTGGSLALHGENSYDGGTTVAAGAQLMLAGATAAGKGGISLGEGSMLCYAGAETQQFSVLENAITGSGSLTVSSGKVELRSAGNTHSGATTVEQGAALRVTAAQSASSQYCVKGGASLHLAVGATLALGDAVSVGAKSSVARALPAEAEGTLENVTLTATALSRTDAGLAAAVRHAAVSVAAAQYAFEGFDLTGSQVQVLAEGTLLRMNDLNIHAACSITGAADVEMALENVTLTVEQVEWSTLPDAGGFGTAYVGSSVAVGSLSTFSQALLTGSLSLDASRLALPLGADYIAIDFGAGVDVSSLSATASFSGGISLAAEHADQASVLLFSTAAPAVPEPAGSAMALLGLATLALRRRR